MKYKNYLKKLLWVLLVVMVSGLMVWRFHIASEIVRIYQEPDFDYYVSLFWEILKELAILLPVWLLCLFGLARSFLGESWFSFSEKIPIRVTKLILSVTAPLLIGVAVSGSLYSEYTNDPYAIQYMLENRFEAWKSTLAWILFYGILLYIEQCGIRQNCSRKIVHKQQTWVAMTIVLIWMILFELSCVDLWYIPLNYVGSPNTLEDYYLWWFSLYSAVFLLPFLFFSVRKVTRLFKNDDQWLTLSMIVPKKITALFALVEAGLIVWQVQESQNWNEWAEIADVPEYGEAAALGHTFQALMWGLALFYTICLLIKQILAVRRVKRKKNTQNLI